MPYPVTTVSVAAALLLLGTAARADVKVCNEFVTTVHVAFASHDDAGYRTEGWWTVPKDTCQDIDFTFSGNTLYYTAHSDEYRSGRFTKRDHWGNKLQLFVGSKKFSFTNADQRRRGAKADMFSSASGSSQLSPEAVVVTVHFKSGGTTVEFKPKQ